MTVFIILQISEIARRGQLYFAKIHFSVCRHSQRKRLSHFYDCPHVTDNHIFFGSVSKPLSVIFLSILERFAGILVENLILYRVPSEAGTGNVHVERSFQEKRANASASARSTVLFYRSGFFLPFASATKAAAASTKPVPAAR